MYEEVLMAEEGMKDTANPMVHIGSPITFDEEEFYHKLDCLEMASYKEKGNIKFLIQDIVPTYTPFSPKTCKQEINVEGKICIEHI